MLQTERKKENTLLGSRNVGMDYSALCGYSGCLHKDLQKFIIRARIIEYLNIFEYFRIFCSYRIFSHVLLISNISEYLLCLGTFTYKKKLSRYPTQCSISNFSIKI